MITSKDEIVYIKGNACRCYIPTNDIEKTLYMLNSSNRKAVDVYLPPLPLPCNYKIHFAVGKQRQARIRDHKGNELLTISKPVALYEFTEVDGNWDCEEMSFEKE